MIWIAGIGAALFLLGTIFFLHWAIQAGWMGPEIRFALSLLAGAGLSVLAGNLLLGDSRRLGVALLLAGLGTLQFAFRAGAMVYHFYDPALGLGAVVLITLVAGGLAARSRSSAALTVSLASGLAAPLIFSQGGHHEVALALYLIALMAGTLAVPYLSGTGEAWHGSRWTALGGTWALLSLACANATKPDAPALATLLALHLLLAGLWTWLPGCREKPGTPTTMWVGVSILATALGWLLWKCANLSSEAFALPVLVVAVLNLALVKPLRTRLGSRQADWGLLALAVGHLALAVPIALAWRWVGTMWGVFAAAMTGASLKAEEGKYADEAEALRWLAAGLAFLTTLRWVFHGLETAFSLNPGFTPLLNPAFAEGALASIAWFLLTRRAGPVGMAAFLALEVTANMTMALEAARLVQSMQGPGAARVGFSRAASISMTLVWALSGAWQWMRGLREEDSAGRALQIAGYVWMGFAGLKLLTSDLDQADTPLRALAFLGVGGIAMIAAVLANRRPRKQTP
ncbi:DUF2339 domain-containing protein [Geothrix sp. 21YS21S-4]|uniref:DUF2339 domain-containing protein n=1 Tax=Geothrix sp. 21YS21S-4 TaxID=3068889 RepID=UPI0027B93EED|nr:DUF2339 domain-containing protein [Geothrix sp. 21YS21S-4]